MPDHNKNEDQLIRELEALRHRVKQLENSEADLRQSLNVSREYQQRYRTFMDNSVEGIWHIDENGCTIYLNRAMCSFLEIDGPEELAGITFHRFFSPDSLETMRPEHAKRTEGVASSYEVEIIGKKGGRRDIIVSGTPILSDHGDLHGLIGVFTDITKHKRTEEELIKANEKLQALIQASPVGIALLDKEGKVTLWSPSAQKILGWDEDEVIGRHFSMISMEREWGFDRHLKQILQGASIGDLELVGRGKDEVQVHILLSMAPLIHKTGNTYGVAVLMNDISEYTDNQMKIHESESRYRMLIESTNSFVFVLDGEGKFEFVNRYWTNKVGYTPNEVIGTNGFDLIDTESIPHVREKFIQAFEGHFVENIEFRSNTKDGEPIDVIINLTPIWDSTGKITRVLGTGIDVTEHKRAEEARAMLEQQFLQVQKMESIGRLAGGVAHDLNNLLSPILGYSELLIMHTEIDDPRKKKLEQVLSATKRAQDLVGQLLAFSRKQTLEYRPLDLNKVITDFRELLRRTIREDVEIEIVQSTGLPAVMADIGQVEQVIMNLAVNAAEAMPLGGSLTMETSLVELDEEYAARHADVKPGAYAMLAVSDTGHGIDEIGLANIFEPFYSTKGKENTGLGLATVYGIIKQHGGHIWVYSEPGRGTTFKVYLPASEISPTDIKTCPPKCHTHPDLRGTETILLVEDNKQVCDLVQDILIWQGYTVLIANGGAEALEIQGSLEGPLDLLVTDVIMPEMNGKELYALMAEKIPNLKVLFMSGYTYSVIAHHGVLDEGVQFIQKPFSVRSLAAKVREVLDA